MPHSSLTAATSAFSADVEHSAQPIELALDAALLVMRSGGSTVAAERSFANVLRGCHRRDVTAVWRLDFIAATTEIDGRATTIVRPVGPIGVNLVRVSEVQVLSERAARFEVGAADLAAELQRITQLRSPYGRWVVVVVAAFTGASFSQLPGGDAGSFGIAFVAVGVGQLVRSVLQGRQVAAAHVTLACGLLSALIATAGVHLGFSHVVPATLVGSVSYMVPGLPLINGFVDLTSHTHLLVGFERMMNATFVFLILAIALAFAHTIVL